MRNKILSVVFMLVLIFALFPQSLVGHAKSVVSDKQNPFEHYQILLANNKDCKSTKDPNAPCITEVFSNTDVTSRTVTPQNISQVVTCGVNIKTRLGVLVATLSETVYVYWTSASVNVTNATRSSWAASTYGWINLAGPTPKTGWSPSILQIKTTGRNTWLLGAPINHVVVTNVSGTQYNNPTWNCTGSY